MDVKNRLARRRAYIGHDPIARLGNSFELRNGSANLEQRSKAFNVMVLEIFEGWNMTFWNHEGMNRGLGIGIIKGKTPFILINFFAFKRPLDNSTKDAITHPALPPSFFCFRPD